jgi:hypothetical protein
MQIPYFGEIAIKSLETDYRIEVKIGQKKIELDINFSQKTTDLNTIETIKNFLENIEEMDKGNRINYNKDFFSREGETKSYAEFYLEESFEEELKDLIDLNQSSENQQIELINKLELIRIGIYPNQKKEGGHFGVFDYSIRIDNEYCNQLLVVITDDKGKLDHITWES